MELTEHANLVSKDLINTRQWIDRVEANVVEMQVQLSSLQSELVVLEGELANGIISAIQASKRRSEINQEVINLILAFGK